MVFNLNGSSQGLWCGQHILEDKQRTQQLFMNLNKIKAEHETWGNTFMVDTNIVKNLNDLRQQSTWPKYLRAPWSATQGNPIQQVETGKISQDSYNMPNVLAGQASSDLWLDERALWVSPNSSLSATENQRIQKNQNIKLILNNRINQWGEKDFWKMWLRSYYEFFNYKDEKNILLNNSFGNTQITIKRKDIYTSANIDIKIINKSEEREMNEKNKLSLLTVSNLVMDDPNSPNISKTFAKRSIAKAQWLKRDQINVLFPPSYEEMDAKSQLDLLNADEKLDPDNIDIWEDHMTYLVVYQNASDTEAKREAIEARTQAYINSGQNRQQPQEQNSNGWISAQIANQAIQAGQEQWATSLADINTQ